MPDPSPQALTPMPADAFPAPDLPRETLGAFVQILAQWGNVRAAALQAGVSRAHLYRMRRANAEFRNLWDAALVIARPQVEEVLADRALNGVTETVFYHGEEVATRTRYDSRLLLAHIARLDRVEQRSDVARTAREFDAAVARLIDPPVIGDWDDDDAPNGCDEDSYDDDGEGWGEDDDWEDDDDEGDDDTDGTDGEESGTFVQGAP